MDRTQFLKIGVALEASLVCLALVVGWLFDVNPLQSLYFDGSDIVWGLLGAVPVFALLVISDRLPLADLKRIKRMLIEMLGNSLNACRWYELILLAGWVGFCEELLFRGLIQPWIAQYAGEAGGLLWSNVLFGLAHCVTLAYGLLAGLMGAYLGWLLDATGERSLLIPITTHAFYDYLAFLWIARAYREEQEQQISSHSEAG
ncbi:MAG: hypothetical protein Tsb009_14600 [Planctomycetaceae bacterium]